MSDLHQIVRDYLSLRRSLGFKLEREGSLLPDFVAYDYRQHPAYAPAEADGECLGAVWGEGGVRRRTLGAAGATRGSSSWVEDFIVRWKDDPGAQVRRFSASASSRACSSRDAPAGHAAHRLEAGKRAREPEMLAAGSRGARGGHHALLGSPPAARADPARGPAYLVFAGPYSSSPSSAFGHLFLALADEPDQAPPLWDVITFNAETFDADPLRYVTVGILGGFLGRYDRVSFHEKTREYGVLDDRDLWLLELRLTAAERAALDEAIRAREGSWYPYTYFSRNCAYYLQLLLAEVTGVVPLPSGTVSPTGVFDAVRGTRIGGGTFCRPAASRRLMASSASVAPPVRERLEEDGWVEVAADTAWHAALRPRDRRFVQQVLALRSTRRSTSLPRASHDGLARLRVANVRAMRRAAAGDGFRGTAEGVSTPAVQASTPAVQAATLPSQVTMPASQVTMPAFHRYSRLRVLQGRGAVGEARTSVAIRGAMHDEADPWFGHRPLNTMRLLALRVSTGTRRFAPRVEEVVVFSQRALAAGDWIPGPRLPASKPASSPSPSRDGAGAAAGRRSDPLAGRRSDPLEIGRGRTRACGPGRRWAWVGSAGRRRVSARARRVDWYP